MKIPFLRGTNPERLIMLRHEAAGKEFQLTLTLQVGVWHRALSFLACSTALEHSIPTESSLSGRQETQDYPPNISTG